jgi:hypothetical protein
MAASRPSALNLYELLGITSDARDDAINKEFPQKSCCGLSSCEFRTAAIRALVKPDVGIEGQSFCQIAQRDASAIE